MRVAFVLAVYPPYSTGIRRFVDSMAHWLAREGRARVEILAASLGPSSEGAIPGPEPLEEGPVTVREIGGFLPDPRTGSTPYEVRLFLRGFGSAVEDFDPDVIHSTHEDWFVPNLQVALGSGGRRLVITPFHHAVGRAPRAILSHLPKRIALRMAHCVHAVTRAEAQSLERLYRLDPRRVLMAPLGQRIPRDDSIRGFPGRDTVLFVGRLNTDKNPTDAARAYLSAVSPASSRRMVFVGEDWGQGESVATLFRAAGRPDELSFETRVSEERLGQLYSRALALLHPSRAESFSYPLCEAQSRGCPVVAYDLPSTVELFGDCAVLVPRRDVEAMGRALHGLLADADRWAERSKQARSVVVERYGIDRMAGELWKRYAD